MPPPPVVPAAPPRPARPPAPPREESHRPIKQRRPHAMAVSIAMGASVLVLVGLCAAAVVWRAALIGVFPPAERVFLWLGLV